MSPKISSSRGESTDPIKCTVLWGPPRTSRHPKPACDRFSRFCTARRRCRPNTVRTRPRYVRHPQRSPVRIYLHGVRAMQPIESSRIRRGSAARDAKVTDGENARTTVEKTVDAAPRRAAPPYSCVDHSSIIPTVSANRRHSA